MRNDFFGEMAETGGVPLNASPVRRWAGVFGHRPFAFSISMGVKTSDGMNWNLQDLVYEALSEEWRKRDGEISDPWANDEADGYQPPSYVRKKAPCALFKSFKIFLHSFRPSAALSSFVMLVPG